MLRLNLGNDLIIELLHLDLMSSSVSPPLYNRTAIQTAGYPPAIRRRQSFGYRVLINAQEIQLWSSLTGRLHPKMCLF